MVSLRSLLLNVAQNFRISAPDSQQLSQDLSQNYSISCPNMGPLILAPHRDERFLNYEVRHLACWMEHCTVTVLSRRQGVQIILYWVKHVSCIIAPGWTHAQHPFCSFLSERSLFRGHYSIWCSSLWRRCVKLFARDLFRSLTSIPECGFPGRFLCIFTTNVSKWSGLVYQSGD